MAPPGRESCPGSCWQASGCRSQVIAGPGALPIRLSPVMPAMEDPGPGALERYGGWSHSFEFSKRLAGPSITTTITRSPVCRETTTPLSPSPRGEGTSCPRPNRLSQRPRPSGTPPRGPQAAGPPLTDAENVVSWGNTPAERRSMVVSCRMEREAQDERKKKELVWRQVWGRRMTSLRPMRAAAEKEARRAHTAKTRERKSTHGGFT
jgi:hypothetical protein